MAYYLTIPEVTEAEELVAFNTGSSGHSFDIVINAGDTSTWLFRAAADGTFIPLVVVVADGPMIALDDVVVSAAASAGSPVDTPHDLHARRTGGPVRLTDASRL